MTILMRKKLNLLLLLKLNKIKEWLKVKSKLNILPKIGSMLKKIEMHMPHSKIIVKIMVIL